MDFTDTYDRLVSQTKHGPPWNPRIVKGVCCHCERDERVVRWMGYTWCPDCLPDLPRALMNAPERCECTHCQAKRHGPADDADIMALVAEEEEEEEEEEWYHCPRCGEMDTVICDQCNGCSHCCECEE